MKSGDKKSCSNIHMSNKANKLSAGFFIYVDKLGRREEDPGTLQLSQTAVWSQVPVFSSR